MYLDLRELKSFSVLACELHFRRAAERLSVSQPTLSKQIRRLEEKVGGALFARTRRKVALTETGRVFLPLRMRFLATALERSLRHSSFLALSWLLTGYGRMRSM